jgi:Tol biopolymer transport system component
VRLTSNPTADPVLSGAISPDALLLAYSDSMGVHIRNLQTGAVRTATLQDGGSPPAKAVVTGWFPDGSAVLANTGEAASSAVWIIPREGGNSRRIVSNGVGWSVSPDGRLISVTRGREIHLIDAAGGAEQRVIDLGAESSISRALWSPDGDRIAFLRRAQTGSVQKVTLESVPVSGGARTTLFSDPNLNDFGWLTDGRIVYTIENSMQSTCNLFVAAADRKGTEPLQKSERRTRWLGGCAEGISPTRDGTSVSVLQKDAREAVYVADLDSLTNRISSPVPLTASEGDDSPMAWLPDGATVVFESSRTGRNRAFAQSLGAAAREIDGAGDDAYWPRVSPDGQWIIYQVLGGIQTKGETPVTFTGDVSLMRVPVHGGAAQTILRAPLHLSHRCAIGPGKPCVISELSSGGKQLLFTSVDPVAGRGRELARFDIDPRAYYSWDLAPDGSLIVIAKYGEDKIHVLHLDGSQPTEITVNGWTRHQGFDWAANGKGFYLGTQMAGGSALLYSDLKGNTSLIWQQPNAARASGVPSPDGRHLALLGWKEQQNLWLVKGL